MEAFAFDVCAHCCSLLVVELCEQLYVRFLDALFPQGRPHAAVPHCVEGSLQVDGCDPQRLVPLGGSLSELLERVNVVCRGVAWSETCLVIGLVVVLCGLLSFEEKLAEEFL